MERLHVVKQRSNWLLWPQWRAPWAVAVGSQVLCPGNLLLGLVPGRGLLWDEERLVLLVVLELGRGNQSPSQIVVQIYHNLLVGLIRQLAVVGQ